ncbi:MAG: alpha/beta hydrolase-fold protein [Bacteroidota bacterium]|jgi:enterochelin esterase family protein
MKRLAVFLLFSSSLLSAESFSSFIRRLNELPDDKRFSAAENFVIQTPSFPIIEQDSLVHFVYFGTAASVAVNGNLQRWVQADTLTKINCGKASLFYRSYRLPVNARLDYQFVVDGTYVLDPFNKYTTPSGFGTHSELRMPKFISNGYFEVRDSVPRGKILTVQLMKNIPPVLQHYMPLSGKVVKVYLPPGYDTLSSLPSVYIQDGDDAIEYAHIPAVIDNLLYDRKIKPIIAVFISPGMREQEYLGAARDFYTSTICDKFVPLIDEAFKTDRSPRQRAVMGISAGAHISLYIAFSRPDIFQNVAGQSSTITPQLTELTVKKAAKGLLAPPMKIYLDCGRYDIVNFPELNRRYSDLLSAYHVPHYYKEVNDGHEWGSWRERMPEIFLYFFRK